MRKILILLILAFIVGVVVGVSQIDFNILSDNANNTTIIYEDVTNNVSYYENVSSSQVDNSSDDGNYFDSSLKVYNISELNKNNIK